MKTILLTGATRGIGLATAKRLLARGCRVLALGRDFRRFDREIELRSPAVERIAFDLRRLEAIESLVEGLPPLDVLVNNAAMLTAQPFDRYPLAERRDLIAVNLEAPAELARACLARWLARPQAAQNASSTERGRIVNVASVAAFGGHPDVWYGASKAALINLTKSLAKRYGPEGVLVNAVAPGPTKTGMFDRLPPERIAEFERLVLARRFAEPDEVACVIEWLALDAPEYVNGATIDVTSG
ncbi:MAG: SDR family oxidoreductase, partial [Burkholderiales bacterium]|nr:SDR family oxidoreductase [Burkholderiales bacterium]